jgi:multiple sugar transport system substrate-binding protein
MGSKTSRRTFLKFAGLSATGAVLAACGGQAAPAPPAQDTQAEATQPTQAEAATAPPPPAEKQVVTFTMYGHPGMVEEMVPLFNSTHPDIEVQFERSEGQGYWEKLAASLAGGSAWDCFRGDQVRAIGWGPKGVVADVRPFMEADTVYPMDGYLPGVTDVYQIGGAIYGVPTWCLTMWMFYNKKMFDEAGIPYPTDDLKWADYVEIAKKLTKTDADGRITQYGTNGWEGWTFPVAQVVWSNKGDFYYTPDMQKIGIDNPQTAAALQDIADLIHVHKTNPSPLNPPTSPVGILSDNVATEGNGDYLPWDNKDVWMEKYDYLDAVQCPTRDGNRANIYWPDAFLVDAKSEVKEGAYRWCSWFGSDPAAIAIQCKVVFPVITKAYEDPAIASTWLQAPRPPGMIASALDHTKTARLWYGELHLPDLDGVYYGEIGRLWNNEASAEEVVADMQKLMDEVMAQPVDVEL